MTPGTGPAFEQAMSDLLLRVNRDNVLAASRAFQSYADQLEFELRRLHGKASLGLCGGDPISREAVSEASFGGKINKLFDVHWDHWEELVAVAARLRDAARNYGYNEEAIKVTFPEPPS